MCIKYISESTSQQRMMMIDDNQDVNRNVVGNFGHLNNSIAIILVINIELKRNDNKTISINNKTIKAPCVGNESSIRKQSIDTMWLNENSIATNHKYNISRQIQYMHMN